eukprot:5982525-Prorocentrum_lima.AAC.1
MSSSCVPASVPAAQPGCHAARPIADSRMPALWGPQACCRTHAPDAPGAGRPLNAAIGATSRKRPR